MKQKRCDHSKHKNYDLTRENGPIIMFKKLEKTVPE